MTVHYLFPDEYHFTSRKITAANNTTKRTVVPPAAMLEWAEEHDFPNVNTTRQPPALAAYRQSRMNKMPAAVEAFFAALALVALIGLAMVPDRVEPMDMVEASQ